MELRQIRYFVGVCEAGSLLKASTRLHVAQPALGQQISALEHDVGARLFTRSSRGMALTDVGRAFLEHARVLLADVERARASVREAGEVPAGDVVLGLPTTVALIATVPILQACRDALPQVRLRLVEAYSGFLREWLVAGRLDIALLYGDPADTALITQPLLDDRLALVSAVADASDRRSPAARRRVSLASLSRWPLVLPGPEHGLRRLVDEACAREGVALRVVAEIDSLPSVKRAVEAGLGCTILPPGAVAEEVAAGRLRAQVIEGPGMSRRMVCATSAMRPGTAASAAVMQQVADVVRQMVEGGRWPARWVGGPTGRGARSTDT